MPKEVYTVEEITLQDGTAVTLKPANIKSLKKFMKVMEKMQNLDSEDNEDTEIDLADILVDAASVLLKKDRPEFWDDTENKHTDEAEEALDMPTVHKIIEVCGGVKLNDPNLLAAAAEMAASQAGKTST